MIFIQILVIVGGSFLLTVLTPTVYSFIRTAGITRFSRDFYWQDKQDKPGEFIIRKYRNFRHFLYSLIDLLRYTLPIFMVYVFKTIPAKFREKIMIATALGNSCNHWLAAHKRFGRVAGLTSQQIDDLVALNPENFEHREWIALQWLRTFLIFEGKFPDPQLNSEFEQLYSRREQVYIFSIFKGMFFFNVLATTFVKERYKPETACAINLVDYDKKQRTDPTPKNWTQS